MTRKLIGLCTLLAALALPASALAWDGAHWYPNTCGADFTANTESGPWWIRVSDETGTLYESTAPGKKYTPVSPLTVGGWSNDTGFHVVKYEAGNAADHRDGYVTYSQAQLNCAGKQGPAGPAGPKGDPGQNGKDSNTATSSTTTVIIHEAPKLCTSKRTYAFRVRKTYRGRRIVAVTASERGIEVKVRKSHGRFVVSWSTKGKQYTPGGIFRSVTVKATLAGLKKPVRLQWDYRPCMSPDGTLNDPSAAGQGTGGGS
jgi:hypothetical protein